MAGIKDLVRLTGLPDRKIMDVFDAIYSLAKTGAKVKVLKFGTFYLRYRKAREIKSTSVLGSDGKRAKVKESTILWFKPSPFVVDEITVRGRARKIEEE